MYNNPYYQSIYNPQSNIDKINEQITQLEKMKQQMQQPVQQSPITQNFQLAPNNNAGIRYTNSIEEIKKDTVFVDTPFFSKDLSVVWIKNPSGNIKAFELNEIVEKDEKDLQIDYLMAQINELKGMISNEQPISNVNETKISKHTTANDDTVREPSEESKSSNVSRVSKSKEK